ncbi:MAG: hypothetical protein A2Z19_04070 [Deltaproteobacteria bacterium RBG_16_54_18]|nr:MAG: hypothetical protein A2Z19_04070 [Deltaproteobacteria bacterium RBG_16_54_18]
MNVRKSHMRRIIAIVLASLLLAPALVWGQGEDQPGGTEIVFDLVIARPLGFVGLVLGTSIFLATYPCAVVTGSAKKTAHALVTEPYEFTFERDLGSY